MSGSPSWPLVIEAIKVDSVPSAEWLLADACEISSLEEAALQRCNVVVAATGDDKVKYDKTEITAKPGETLRVVLKSVGTAPKAIMAHNFVLLKAGVDPVEFNKASFAARATDYVPTELRSQIIAATGLAGPGETVEVTVKVPTQPGRYTYLCTFPGHFALGMRGVLIVK